MDPELAEVMAEAPKPVKAERPMDGYTPLMSALDDIKDLLILVRATLVNVNGGSDKPRLVDRPRSMVEILRARAHSEALDATVFRLLGG